MFGGGGASPSISPPRQDIDEGVVHALMAAFEGAHILPGTWAFGNHVVCTQDSFAGLRGGVWSRRCARGKQVLLAALRQRQSFCKEGSRPNNFLQVRFGDV